MTTNESGKSNLLNVIAAICSFISSPNKESYFLFLKLTHLYFIFYFTTFFWRSFLIQSRHWFNLIPTFVTSMGCQVKQIMIIHFWADDEQLLFNTICRMPIRRHYLERLIGYHASVIIWLLCRRRVMILWSIYDPIHFNSCKVNYFFWISQ